MSFREKLAYYFSRARLRFRFYARRLMPPVTKTRVADVQMQLRDSSTPDFDYFVLVFLSCTIATFGLLIDSAATIIGAMLVAPLMSPILGIGLASIRGDTNLAAGCALCPAARRAAGNCPLRFDHLDQPLVAICLPAGTASLRCFPAPSPPQ